MQQQTLSPTQPLSQTEDRAPRWIGPLRNAVIAAMVLAAILFWALHLLHLEADFPNHSPWGDWAKYTDEGWYGDAAIRFFERGSWYLAGDFNPAVALPVLPLLEALVFRFTGVTIVAARALSVVVFGALLVLSFLLVRRTEAPARRRHTAAAAATVLLLATSPFCYAFSRLAIIEPLLMLLMLLAVLVASAAPAAGVHLRRGGRVWIALTLGVLLPALILTKTTAVFLFPALSFLVWARGGFQLRPLARTGGTAALLGVALWAAYYGLIVRPHYLDDYHYLFSANSYTKVTLHTAVPVAREMMRDTFWIGDIARVFACMALLAILFWIVAPRQQYLKELLDRLQRHALLATLVLWILGYAAFLTYHNNLQARYYFVLIVPMAMFTPLAIDLLWRRSRSLPLRAGLAVVCALLAGLVTGNARQTFDYVRHPEYTFLNAARSIATITRADTTRSPLVLSISGSTLSLMTGIPSICDDFGTFELADRVAAYQPGWFVTWNQVDDDKMDALGTTFHLHRVAAFPVMDDPERNLLILYRLDAPIEPRRGRGKGRAHRLLTQLNRPVSPLRNITE